MALAEQAKNMNAVVKAFDVRAAAAEQVESMGASFLHVDFDEDGDGGGGYAKEMSPEWFEAADNPNFDYRPIDCPEQLVARSGTSRG